MDLLEDPRHGRKERRLELHQVGHDLLRVLLPVSDRGADIEHQELNDQREGVRQRQEQVHALVHAHDVLRLQCRGNSAVVAVRKLTGLRRPGRPRRVDEQARGVRRDAVDALLKLGLRPPSPPLAQHLEREHAAIGVRGLHHDHELQRRQVRLDGADLRQLLCVLDEHRPRPGVMQHVMALLRRVRLVDRRDNRAGGKRRKTGVGPLRPRVRQDRNPVSRLDAQVDEPKRQLRHRAVELLVGDLDPLTIKLVLERRLAAMPCRRQRDQISHRPRAGANHPSHPFASLSCTQAGDCRGTAKPVVVVVSRRRPARRSQPLSWGDPRSGRPLTCRRCRVRQRR